VKNEPRVSVVIPTRNRAVALSRCLERLAGQSLPAEEFEVIVVHDGDDPDSCAAATQFASRLRLTDLTAPRLGVSTARNTALEHARAELVLLLNDDVLSAPDLLERHVRAHGGRSESQPPALVVGYSPFAEAPAGEATLFDRLMERTSAVFFYDRMLDANGLPTRPAGHDWGYRHAWTLNLSFPTRIARLAGGFRPAIANWCYEDVEFAWRAATLLGSPVLFCPEARAVHDHRMSPEGYLERERRLGYSALGFARAAPECARQLFGRDLTESEPWYARAFVEREARDEGRHSSAFLGACALPGRLADEPESGRRVVELLYAQHLPLKRLAFRRGLLEALEGRRFEGLFHPSDGLPTEPPALARRAA